VIKKTIDSFDFAAQPSINEAMVREFLEPVIYIPKKEKIFLVGQSPGPGEYAREPDMPRWRVFSL